ncbi:DUF3530 family protein [Piscirickettsia litoralis]|uniref:DUF3530 family protein n=1 Tax=Piscirickettsia litoralis TaxID=1891921 RepID=UPI001F3CE4DE|nr:DUF3530 family protein [Piscirickettsia litoralis]
MKYLALSSLALTLSLTLANAYGAEDQAEQDNNKPSTASPSEFMINSGHLNQQQAMTKRQSAIKLQYAWLNADGKAFLTATKNQYLQADAKGAVIILHDEGQHLRWPSPLSALYQTLPEHGWTVLSLQLSKIQTESKKSSDSNNSQQQQLLTQRLWLCVELLRSQGLHNIAMIALGRYADQALNYLANQTTQKSLWPRFAQCLKQSDTQLF